MFSNLVESGSHGRDLKRKSSFFIGTFLFYAIFLSVAGVGSIYAYNVQLDADNDYEINILHFPRIEAQADPLKQAPGPKPAASGGGGKPLIAKIRDLVLNRPLEGREVAPETARALPPGTVYEIGPDEFFPPNASGGIDESGPVGPGGSKDSGPAVSTDTEAPTIKPAPTPKPEPPQRPSRPISLPSSVIAGKTLQKPAPPYPDIARVARQQGRVLVQIVVDEDGKVISAKASSGPPLLLYAAEKAAYQARFSPTLLSGLPVKVSGVITYNFILN
jgi:protein TonB